MNHNLDPITATTISHYVRLGRCERYLRFNLRRDEMRAMTARFEDLGVEHVRLAPTLRAAGAFFEQRIVDSLPDGTQNLEHADVAATLATMTDLLPEQSCVLVQAPLAGTIGGWPCQGKTDIMRARRTSNGSVDLFVADIKSSREARVEHRLQVAFYIRMLRSMLEGAGQTVGSCTGAVIVMGNDGATPRWDDPASVFDLAPYDLALAHLLEGDDADVARVARQSLSDTPYSLGYKCDGCRFNQLCMVDSADRQDITLVPFIQPADVRVLRTHGVHSLAELAGLKTLPAPDAWNRPFPVAPGNEERVGALRLAQPVGPKLDRLVQRARAMERKFDPAVAAYGHLLDGAWSQLPSDEEHPDLVKIFIDAQHDYVQDRIYLLGALVVGPGGNVPLVHITAGPPSDTDEAAIVVDMLQTMLGAISQVARDPASVPLHFYLYDSHDQRVVLEALGRNLAALCGVPAFYDLLTATPALGQPMVSVLATEIRDRRNLPIVCQNLYNVANVFGFKWTHEGDDFSALFRRHLFDTNRRRSDGVSIEKASRFSSGIPLEYAYGAWDRLPDDPETAAIILEYRRCTPETLVRFQAHRLRALAHIEGRLTGKSRQISKTPLPLSQLGQAAVPEGLARSLEEFLALEHHAALQERLALFALPIERRVETGRAALLECLEVTKERGGSTLVRFRIDYASLQLDGTAARQSLRLKEDDWMLLNPADGRSGWKIVHGRIAVVQTLTQDTVTLELRGSARVDGSVFRYFHDNRVVPEVGERWTLDEMVDDLNADKFLDAARHTADNVLFAHLLAATPEAVQPVVSERGRVFRERVRALEAPAHRTEKQEQVIAAYDHAPVLCVQGPPGSGKTATLGWAILERLFVRDERPLRVAVCARTHKATTLVLGSVAEKLRLFQNTREGRALGTVTVFKVGGDAAEVPAGVRALNSYVPGAAAAAFDQPVAVIGGTAGGLYTLVKRAFGDIDWSDKRFDLLVIDEASQMSLPEALLAAALLKADGQILIVGDHRQMPPILKHDWERELKRSAREHQPYRSIFETMIERGFPRVGLDESFRLHRSQAAFLYEHIYQRDGIAFHSRKEKVLPALSGPADPYVAAALRPDFPVVVIEHDESLSQQFNALEVELVRPLIAACQYDLRLDARDGIGIVVPHRAQKAALRTAFPELAAADAIDTVERFQGGERDVIIVSATASDPEYVLQESSFLLNLNRLNVAISRPRLKLIVIASSTIFRLLVDDADLFEQALLWKHLRYHHATEALWTDRIGTHNVRMFGGHCGHALPAAAPVILGVQRAVASSRRERRKEAW